MKETIIIPSPEQEMRTRLKGHLSVALKEFLRDAQAVQPEPTYETIVEALCSRFHKEDMEEMGIGEFVKPYYDAKRAELLAKIEPAVREHIANHYSWIKPQKDGTYVIEMFADYDQVIQPDSLQNFLREEDPYQAFVDYLERDYEYVRMNEREDMVSQVYSDIDGDFIDYDEDIEDLIRDTINEIVIWGVPEEHFLKQEVRVSIQMDAGNGHRGFYEFDSNNELDKNSGILWLVKQQGYSEADFRALLRDEIDTASGFMASAKQEIENATYADNVLTFLVRMTVKQLLDLAAATKLQDRNGKIYDTTLIPNCGTITLDAKTNCGLFNPWNGSGGPIAVEPEKDIVIPIAYIHDLVVEYNSHKVGGPYLMMESFDLCGSAWKETLKEFNPIKLEEE